MTGVIVASVLAAAAVLVLRPARPFRTRGPVVKEQLRAPGRTGDAIRRGQGADPPFDPGQGAPVPGPGQAVQRAAAGVAGLACAGLVGGGRGLVVGVGVAAGLAVFLGRLETGEQRRERAALAADAPIAADLLGAALAAGVPVESALPVVAEAIGGPLGRRLRRVSGLLRLGQPPDSAWEQLGSEPALRPLASAASRSARTGAPLADLLTHAALELRTQAHAAARAEIRAAGVRSVLPLGLCLLPAFVLLSVVPLVGGLVAVLWG